MRTANRSFCPMFAPQEEYPSASGERASFAGARKLARNPRKDRSRRDAGDKEIVFIAEAALTQ